MRGAIKLNVTPDKLPNGCAICEQINVILLFISNYFVYMVAIGYTAYTTEAHWYVLGVPDLTDSPKIL